MAGDKTNFSRTQLYGSNYGIIRECESSKYGRVFKIVWYKSSESSPPEYPLKRSWLHLVSSPTTAVQA